MRTVLRKPGFSGTALICAAALTLTLLLGGCPLPDGGPPQYTITFDSQGGSPVQPVTGEESAKIEKPADPAKEGSLFRGWYSAASGGMAYVWPHTLIADVTMYARWEPEPSGFTSEDQETVKQFDENPVVKEALGTDAGKINLGTADLAGIKADIDAALAAYNSLSDYAKMALAAEKAQLDTAKEKIENVETAQDFMDGLKEGFDISPDEVDTLDKAAGLLPDLAEALAELGALPEAVQDLLAEEIERLEELKGKAEEIVAGSATDGQKAEAAGFKAGHTAILAKTPATVSLADEAAVDAALAAYAGLEDPMAKGLLLEEYGKLTALKAKIEVLKGGPEPQSYTITYVLNDGTNAGVNPASYTSAVLPLTLAAPARSGYTFGGWYTNSGFTGAALTQIPAGTMGNKTFYAKWTPAAEPEPEPEPGPEPYTITFTFGPPDKAAAAFDGAGFILHKEPGNSITIAIKAEDGVKDVSWYIGFAKIGIENKVTLDPANLTLGAHFLRVTAKYNEVLYSKELRFTVTKN